MLNVIIYISQDTLDADVTAARALLTSGGPPTTLTPTRDTVIGGEPAKTFDGTYTQNGSAATAALWMVGHGTRRFVFSTDKIGTHRAEIDAIVGATTFQSAVGTPASTSAVATPPMATAASTTATSRPLPTTPPATTLTITFTDTSVEMSPTRCGRVRCR